MDTNGGCANKLPDSCALSQPMRERSRIHTALHLALLVILPLIIYSNTFHVPFLLDDEASIVNNTTMRSLANYFTNWSGHDDYPFRYVGMASFALNFYFGALNVEGYHAANLAIHMVSGLLVYALVRLTFRTPFLKESQLSRHGASLALAVALLFVCHPIQTQAVTYIYQRLTSLTSMLYLASLVLYLRWRLSRGEGAHSWSGGALACYLFSLVAALLAMNTKEIAFTLPLMVGLCEVAFFGWPKRRQLALMTPMLLTAAIIPYNHLSMGSDLGSYLTSVAASNSGDVTLSRLEYLSTQFSVIVTYLRLLIWPVGQNLDYQYQINHSPFEFRPIISLFVLLALLWAAMVLWRRSSRSGTPELRLAAFGIIWFFLALSIESSIVPIADVIFEHRLYLPSVGFFLSLVTLVGIGSRRFAGASLHLHRLALPVLSVVVLSLSVATYSRNNVWGSWIGLWSDVVSKSPDKARPHNILGIGYINQNRFDDAIREFKTAIRLNPKYREPYYNIGVASKATHKYGAAIDMFGKSLALSPIGAYASNALTQNEIGECYAMDGNMTRAAECFAQAVNFQPQNAAYRMNKARALLRNGSGEAAAQEFQIVLQTDPGNEEAVSTLQEITLQNLVKKAHEAER